MAQKKYTYMVLPTLAPFELRRQAAEYFSACCEKAGYTVRHSQIGWGIGIYVGETDEEARREYEPHYWYYARNLLKTTPQQALPPGHTSLSSVMGMMQRRLQSRPGNLSTWEEVDKAGYVVVGSPETVRQRLEEFCPGPSPHVRLVIATVVPLDFQEAGDFSHRRTLLVSRRGRACPGYRSRYGDR